MKGLKIKNVIIVITFTVFLIFLFVNLDTVGGVLGSVFKVLLPIIYGIVIAYIINWPYKFFKDKCFYKIGQKNKKIKSLRKVLALLCAYGIILGVIIVLFVFLIPQLSTSVRTLVDNFPLYMEKVQVWIGDTVEFIHINTGINLTDAETYNNLLTTITGSNASNMVSNIISWAFPYALSTISSFGTGVYNWVIGFIVSIYLISSKDTLLLGLKKAVIAFLPKKAAVKTLKISNFANNKCGRFLMGKIIDSAIIGVLCFIFMSIFKFDYAVLISVIIGVTNVIPFFGPFIGAIPSAFLLLIVNPMECLWFIIFIILLQQFDGNFLGPKILGESVGLSGFWILFSVLFFGGLFGIPGMLLGVPVFAVIYTLIEDAVNFRLKKKNAGVETSGDDSNSSSGVPLDKGGDVSADIPVTETADADTERMSEEELNKTVSEKDEKELIDKIDEEAKIRHSYYSQF